MTDIEAEPDVADVLAAQRRSLPPLWRRLDEMLLRCSELAVLSIGVLFTAMVTLEVLSRYLLNFSIFFVNAAARFLLVWFFLMGAGIALRHGAHVGFELLVRLVPRPGRRFILLAGHVVTLVFFLEMIWGGVHALGPALGQTEPGLEIRLVWAFLAIPVGFALLAYHTVVLMRAAWVAEQGAP